MSMAFPYKEILNHINDAIFIHSPEGRIIDVNKAMLEMYGFEYHEIVGKSVPLVSDESKGFNGTKAKPLIDAAVRGESPLFEWLAKDKYGTSFWVEVSLSRFEYNNDVLVLAVVRDISKRHPESLLFTQLEEFKNIITTLSTRFISIPIERIPYEIDYSIEHLGKYYSADRAYVFLYSEDNEYKSNTNEWCNKGITPYIDSLQNLPARIFEWEYKMITNNQIINIPDVITMPCEAQVEKEEFQREGIKSLLVVPILHNNIPIGFIGLDSVVKKRNWSKSEEEVLTVVGTTIGSALIRKRNEEKLKLATAKAIESDRLKTAFLANMSHEIRTPMNGIVGFSQLIAEDELDIQDQKKYGQIIYKSSLQLLNIINDIIDISKIEARMTEVNITPFNVFDTINHIYSFYAPQAKQKSLTFKLENQIHPHQIIKTDEVKLRQILNNLVSNAVKYTAEGTIVLEVALSNNKLNIKVKDTGIGMDEEMQKLAFERFVRSKDEYTQKSRGTGLGLAISKALTELLNGEISLNSELHKGSTFSVSIPI